MTQIAPIQEIPRLGRVSTPSKLRTGAISAACIIGTCALLPFLLVGQAASNIAAVAIAYAIFTLVTLGILATNRVLRSPQEIIAAQLTMVPILLLALTIRLAAAYSPGHGFDIAINKGWAMSAVRLGLAHSYLEQLNGNVLPNYPPVIITLFWLAGQLYQFAISSAYDVLLPAFGIVIRFPAIFADLAICCVLASVGRVTARPGTWAIAPLVYALHPVAVYDSSVWGQTDSVFALLMLLALAAAVRAHWMRAGAWTACAALAKPQVAAMFPVLIWLLLRNRRGIAPFAVGALAAAVAVLLPYALAGVLGSVLAVYSQTVGGYYDTISIGAYNFWAIFHRTAEQSDTALAFGVISFRSAGLVLSAAATLLVLWRLRASFSSDHPDERTSGVLLAAALTASALFIFATEMHERYQFAYVVLALPVATRSALAAVLYAWTCLLIMLNLLGAMAFGAIDVALFRALPMLPKLIGVAQIVLFFSTVQSAPRMVRTLRHGG
jgi:Gpi18-like mannosyltransferase